MRTYIHIHVYIRVHTYIHTHTYIQTNTHTHTYIHTYTHMYTYEPITQVHICSAYSDYKQYGPIRNTVQLIKPCQKSKELYNWEKFYIQQFHQINHLEPKQAVEERNPHIKTVYCNRNPIEHNHDAVYFSRRPLNTRNKHTTTLSARLFNIRLLLHKNFNLTVLKPLLGLSLDNHWLQLAI